MGIVVFAILAAIGIMALYKYHITPKRQATLRANNPPPPTENVGKVDGEDQQAKEEQSGVGKDNSKQEDNYTPYPNHQIGTATAPHQVESSYPITNIQSKLEFQQNQGYTENNRNQFAPSYQAENQPWPNSNNNQAWGNPQINQNWEVPQNNQPWKNTYSNQI